MSRILPFKNPTWDYTLWEIVKGKTMLISEDEMEFLSLRDTIKSSKSKFWLKEGRDSFIDTDKKIIDFIGISKKFDIWSEINKIESEKEKIIQEIKRKLENKTLYPGGEHLLNLGINEDFLEIDWGLLGKVIGAAIANEGRRQGWWKFKGRDAIMSNRFWLDMKKQTLTLGGIRSVDSDDWRELTQGYIQHGLDVETELSRSAANKLTNPIIESYLGEEIYYTINPIAFQNRERISQRYREFAEGEEDIEEYANFHGKLTFSAIKDAIDSLNEFRYADFILKIQGICASHLMRTNMLQQKIGMHLFSNLAFRKISRGVEAIPVCDIAQELDTGFGLSRVLEILRKADLIDWYTVEIEHVNNALKNIKDM